MKHFILFVALLLAPPAALRTAETTIPIDSPAFAFSPGNWTGDEGRAGRFPPDVESGRLFRVAWQTSDAKPVAKILLDTSTYPSRIQTASDRLQHRRRLEIQNPLHRRSRGRGDRGSGKHELSVYLHWSQQRERWGSEGEKRLERAAGHRPSGRRG